MLCYSSVRITLRDATGEWTYVSGPWRQHMTMTKERLRREVADWIKRAQHESKLAFAEGDLWTALAWGSKVPDLMKVEKDMREIGYETGIGVDCLYERVGRIIRSIDWSGRIRAMMPPPASYVMGIDMAKGSGHAIASLFAIEMDRLGRQTMKLLDDVTIKSPDPNELDAMAEERFGTGIKRYPTDEQLRQRCRERLEGIGGKSADLIIIDDPFKE